MLLHVRAYLRTADRGGLAAPTHARLLPGVEDRQGSKDLVRVVDSSLRRFFRHARENSLAYVELLFWRTKGENIALSRLYKEPVKRGDRAVRSSVCVCANM